MRKKQVWRYYCDFCKKANCSGASIAKHEQHCTLNPNRVCRMCVMMEQSQPSLAAIIAILPHPSVHQEGLVDWLEWEPNVNQGDVLAQLRDAAGNCPACMLAALRQAKIPVPMMEGFNYGDESNSIRTEYYDNKNSDHYEYVY